MRGEWFGGICSGPWRLWWMPAVLAVVFSVARNGIAQESPVAPAAEEPAPAAVAPAAEPAIPSVPRVNGPLTPVGPDTFILLDAQGRPQPVLGMTYEEFIEAWKKLREFDDADSEPTYILEALHAEGHIEGDAAVLNVRLEIDLKTTGLVELPLGFKDAILRDLDDSEPALQLSYDAARGGYVAWLRSTGQKTVVNLPLLLPLKRDGNKTSLQVNVPRALVNHLQLDSPQRIASAVVSEGAVARLSDRGEEGSRLTVTGIVGDVTLSWSAPGSEATELETVLSVAGQIATSVDGRSARSEARLRVESFGGQFQQFRLRLPPGAQLVGPGAADTPQSQTQYKLLPEVVPSPQGETSSQRGQIWVVELAEATSGPVDVRLITEQALGLSRENKPIELAGFEVLGAVRQFGQLALRVDPNWQLRWNRVEGGRQINVDELEQEVPADPALFAFEYNQQPWSLPVEVQPRGTRVAVAPKYRLELSPDEIRLKVTLQYQLAGSQEMRFRVKLAGWEVTADPIEPTRLIDADNVQVKRDPVLDDDVLELPLTQAASRRTEITFHVRRPLTEQRTKLEMPLPTPLADSIGTGELVIFAHPSLLVIPSPAQEGLAPPRPLTGDAELTSEAGLNQVAAYRSFLPDVVFSADVGPRAGEVEAAVQTLVTLNQQLIQVEHTLNFDAKYRPVSELNLSMPAALMQEPSFRLTLLPGSGVANSEPPGTARAAEGVPLEVRASPLDDENDPSETIRVVSVALPQPRIGRFRLFATYSMPMASARDATPLSAVVPLPLPMQTPVTSQIAVVSARGLEPLELAPSQRDSVWSVAEASDPGATGKTVLKTSNPNNELSLSFQPGRTAGEGRTIIDQVWLQSWCAPDARQQRVVYHLRSNARSLTVELPLEMIGSDVEISLNGMTNVKYERREARLIVPLVESEELAAHTLQLRYLESTGIDPWDQLQIELPQVGGEATFAELYWQVIVPKNFLILRGPSGLAKAHGWKWALDGLRPDPLKTTRELEASIGAMEQRQPAEGEAEYLYSGFGPGSALAVAVARGELLYLIAAGLVLAAGLALLYLPILRRPAVLFAVVVAVIFAGIAYPELLMICGPALAIGAALTILACLLYMLVPRRGLAEPSPSASTVHGTHMSSREIYLSSPVATASSNAPTITLRPSESNI